MRMLKMEETLDSIGRRFGCDKSSLVHDYLRWYEIAFDKLTSAPVILEIGWNDLSSLSVWTSYFPTGTVIGSFAHKPDIPSDARFRVEVGDPNSSDYLASLVERFNPDVIIDDSSHRWQQQKLALRTILPLMKPQGLYIIEDLQTSFVDTQDYAQGSGAQQSTARYLQDLLTGIMSGGAMFTPEGDSLQLLASDIVESIHFSNKICFIKRSMASLRQLSIARVTSQEQPVKLPGEAAYVRIAAQVEGLEATLKLQFDRECGRGTIVAPTPKLSMVENALVYGRGVVTTCDNKLIADSLINVAQNERRFESLTRTGDNRVLALDGVGTPRFGTSRPAVLLKQRWDENYGHWLIESLPRLAMVQQAYDLNACDIIIGKAGGAMNRVYLDSLRLAGVNLDQVLATDDTTIRVGQLIYPHPLTVQPWVKSPVAIGFLERLRDRLDQKSVDAPERLFIRRSRSSRRRLLNEEVILAIAERYGFKTFRVEGASFEQQIQAFRAARFAIGTLGAELSNLVFSYGGVSLLGLSPSTMQDDFYYDLICHKKGRYFSLHGTPSPGSVDGLAADFTIDPARFEIMLKTCFGL